MVDRSPESQPKFPLPGPRRPARQAPAAVPAL